MNPYLAHLFLAHPKLGLEGFHGEALCLADPGNKGKTLSLHILTQFCHPVTWTPSPYPPPAVLPRGWTLVPLHHMAHPQPFRFWPLPHTHLAPVILSHNPTLMHILHNHSMVIAAATPFCNNLFSLQSHLPSSTHL